MTSVALGHLLPHATQQTPSLFDHLVGAHQKRLWDRQAESFGGRKIDDEFEVSRLLDREVFRLGAAEPGTFSSLLMSQLTS